MRWTFVYIATFIIGFFIGSFITVPLSTNFQHSNFLTQPNVLAPKPNSDPTTPAPLPDTQDEASLPTKEVQFDNPIVYAINKTVTYPDGLMVTVTTINDSRCKPDTKCIWAGELSPQLALTGGELGKSVILLSLGTTRTTEESAGIYQIKLGDTSLVSTTLTIGNEPVTTTTTPTINTTSTQPIITSKSPTPITTTTETDFAIKVAELITDATKKLRLQQSLTPYIQDSKLTMSAGKYSTRLLQENHLTHIDTNGCDITCRFSESGYQASSWGENLAMIEYSEEPSAEYVANFFMTQWQKSADHRKNILSPTFTHQGVGVSVKNGNVYATVHFALPL